MQLFDQIISAINEPTKQASTTQLGTIINTVEQLSQGLGVEDKNTQTVTSIVGKYVRAALKEKQQSNGTEATEAVIDKYSGTSANLEAVQALLSPQQHQKMSQEASSSTGLNREIIESMLPTLIPLVLNFLNSGATKGQGQVGNTVLKGFLDTDSDGDVDISDALSLAKGFLSR
ncbi:MAG: hypothetical protein AAGF26_11590 [Cyanobacteria bacterium P01_G01_bin.49]